MTTAGDMKRYISSLADSNESLAAELRASRVSATRIERERDSLCTKLAELRQCTEALLEERDAAVSALDEVRDNLRTRLGISN